MLALPGAFPSRYGVPVLRAVDSAVFSRRYFTHCLQCTFCHDGCCAHGVDVDLLHLREIERHADELERYTGVPRGRWFQKRIEKDDQSPGGGSVRTRVRDGRCVFLNRAGRGCLIHSYCLERGLDYHDLKSIIDCLFPLSWDDDVLCPAYDVEDNSLVCLDNGPTLYRGLRHEVAYYFGERCVRELDRIEAQVTGVAGPVDEAAAVR